MKSGEKYVSKHSEEKKHELKFFKKMSASLVLILFCLAGMGFSAYAWFTGNVTSEFNKISAASYNVVVTVTDDGGNNVDLVDNAFDAAALSPYIVNIAYDSTCTADTGFCLVYINEGSGSSTVYNTEAIVEGKNLAFKINLSNPAKVSFLAHWGEAVNYNYNNIIKNNDVVGEPIVTLQLFSFNPAPVSEPNAVLPGDLQALPNVDNSGNADNNNDSDIENNADNTANNNADTQAPPNNTDNITPEQNDADNENDDTTVQQSEQQSENTKQLE